MEEKEEARRKGPLEPGSQHGNPRVTFNTGMHLPCFPPIKFGSLNMTPAKKSSGLDSSNLLNINLSAQEKSSLGAQWKDSLIIRLWGLNLSKEVLKAKIMRLWNLCQEPIMLEIGFGFFILSFPLVEDKWKALLHGISFIDGHFLSVRKWRERFNPLEHIAEAISPVWVKLESLPLEFYEQPILYRVGNAIGEFIGVDEATYKLSKIRFARICIFKNIKNEIDPMISIYGYQQRVTFEGFLGPKPKEYKERVKAQYPGKTELIKKREGLLPLTEIAENLEQCASLECLSSSMLNLRKSSAPFPTFHLDISQFKLNVFDPLSSKKFSLRNPDCNMNLSIRGKG
ncbi:hypothetical protein G2W53_043068 [Senna tora]|uniref:DUF4283 domain-containing protein n=1 Tax=Senna tora TaxID=362788 RepID=A0A834SNF3_9FABA|nr:hypothetical protein G2W53_043068 [Senna tora]